MGQITPIWGLYTHVITVNVHHMALSVVTGLDSAAGIRPHCDTGAVASASSQMSFIISSSFLAVYLPFVLGRPGPFFYLKPLSITLGAMYLGDPSILDH